MPISAENAEELIPVASFTSASIREVNLSESQDQIFFVSTIDAQSIDLTTFSAAPLSPASYGFPLNREVSPNGQFVAELLPGKQKFFDMYIKITDTATKKVVCEFPPYFPRNNIRLVFHSNNTLSLTSQEGIVRMSIDNCKVTFDKKSVSYIEDISDNGEFIALGEDNKVYLYQGGTNKKTLFAEFNKLLGVHFLGNESILVTTQSGNSIYSLSDGEKIYDFPGNMGKTNAQYSESQDANWILIRAGDINKILQLDENKIYPLPNEFIYISDNPLQSWNGFIENNHLIVNNYIWSIEKQGKVADIKKYGDALFLKQVTVSGDGNYAAVSSAGEPYFTDVYDLQSRKLAYTLTGYHQPLSLPSGDGFVATKNGQTGFFYYGSEQPVKMIDLHYTNGIVLENGIFIVWDSFGNVSQIDPATQSVLHTTRLTYFLPDANIQNMTPTWGKEYDFNFDAFLTSFLDESSNFGSAYEALQISHNHNFGINQPNKNLTQVFSINNEIMREDGYQERILISNIPSATFASAFAFSSDDTMVAGVYLNKIFVWDTQTGNEIHKLSLPNNVWRVYDLEFSPDNRKLLISASEDLGGDNTFTTSIHRTINLRILNLQNGIQLQKHTLEQDYKKTGCNIALPFVVTSDGASVVTITQSCKIGVYDFNTWELKQELGSPIENANIDLALSPNNHLLAIAYRDILEIWDLSSGELIERYKNSAYGDYPRYRDAEFDFLYEVSFSPDGRLIGTKFGSNSYQFNSIVTLWAVPFE
jgi:WD40 repeat protein